jgi:plastocyanin
MASRITAKSPDSAAAIRRAAVGRWRQAMMADGLTADQLPRRRVCRAVYLQLICIFDIGACFKKADRYAVAARDDRDEKMWQHPLKASAAALAIALAGLAIPSAAPAEQRFFTVAAVEPKGGATADKEPFPSEALPGGGGYVLNKPDANNRWEVSTYLWMPGQIIVNEGDEVMLEFVGIHGASHPTTIKDFGKEFVLKRGTVTRVSFVADKVGTFPIVCSTHQPSMSAEIIVLPRRP